MKTFSFSLIFSITLLALTAMQSESRAEEVSLIEPCDGKFQMLNVFPLFDFLPLNLGREKSFLA